MKVEISDNTFKQILNRVVDSDKFQTELRKSIKIHINHSIKDSLKKAYDEGFKNGFSKVQEGVNDE